MPSYASRIADRAGQVGRKALNTIRLVADSRVPVISYYDFIHNWGDALNPVLVRHISGKEPIPLEQVYNVRNSPVYSVIGSILGNYSDPNLEVWGSGFIGPERIFLVPPKKIHAVRGPLTRQVIVKLGLECPEVYGDPALLYPRYYSPPVEKEFDLGVVAHYTDRHDPWLECVAREQGALVIDVTSGVEEFVDQLCRCRTIASSSLHGLIAADSYGIPFTWISLSNRLLGGRFKFEDYFLSTGRSRVEPLEISAETSLNAVYDFAIESRPDLDLDLLYQVCPFRADGSR